MIDGSFNHSVLDPANVLGAMVNSSIAGNANNNANTRADGKKNNTIQ
jgi:hypothetical protein